MSAPFKGNSFSVLDTGSNPLPVIHVGVTYELSFTEVRDAVTDWEILFSVNGLTTVVVPTKTKCYTCRETHNISFTSIS